MASFFGLLYGRHKIWWGKKSLEGFLAAFASCSLVAGLFLGLEGLSPPQSLFSYSLLSGFIGACSEMMVIPHVDDNLSQTLMSSFLMNLFFSLSIGIPLA